MNALLIIVFVIAYAAIAFEHPLKVNKSAQALVGAGMLWTIYAVYTGHVTEQLNETLSSTAQIVFFLMGAMTIVEVVDAQGTAYTPGQSPGWTSCPYGTHIESYGLFPLSASPFVCSSLRFP